MWGGEASHDSEVELSSFHTKNDNYEDNYKDNDISVHHIICLFSVHARLPL